MENLEKFDRYIEHLCAALGMRIGTPVAGLLSRGDAADPPQER
jgi:hypothetical protein